MLLREGKNMIVGNAETNNAYIASATSNTLSSRAPNESVVLAACNSTQNCFEAEEVEAEAAFLSVKLMIANWPGRIILEIDYYGRQ